MSTLTINNNSNVDVLVTFGSGIATICCRWGTRVVGASTTTTSSTSTPTRTGARVLGFLGARFYKVNS